MGIRQTGGPSLNALAQRLREGPAIAARRAAIRIEARLREDSKSRVGKTPDGIRVTVTGDGGISVVGPDWVMTRARDRGQVEAWQAIWKQELDRALAGR